MGKWLVVVALSCGMALPARAELDPTSQDKIFGWNYAVLRDRATGELTSHASLQDLGGGGFVSIDCAPVPAGKPAVFVIISPRESLGRDGEPGRIVYRVAGSPAIQSKGTFHQAVHKDQVATYILPSVAPDPPRMLRRMTQGTTMNVELSPQTPSVVVNLHFHIGDVKVLYRRMEKDCPGFTKTF
jgi:hypothetical protein